MYGKNGEYLGEQNKPDARKSGQQGEILAGLSGVYTANNPTADTLPASVIEFVLAILAKENAGNGWRINEKSP